MIYMLWILGISVLYLALIGCSSNKVAVPDNPPFNIYTSAQKKLQEGNYNSSIKELEELDNHYPFGPYTYQVYLDLIYAYYKSANLPLARAVIDRFLRLNPIHPNIDYVLYMRALIDMTLDDNVLQSFLSLDHPDRNSEHARAAFRNFMQLIRDYPNSQYAMDATKRLVYLKNRLARYELYIVKYYDKRGAYVAVANRVDKMLRDFPDTQATLQALPYMEKAYRELQLIEQADKVLKIREANITRLCD